MNNKLQAGSERLVETISKFEDQIEDTKFAIATMRIQLAFRILMKVSQQKKTEASIILLQRLKDISVKKIAFSMQRPLVLIFDTLQRIKERTMIKAFLKVKLFSQNIQKESSSSKKTPLMQSITGSRKKITVNSNGYQMSNEQMQEECIFLKDQIKKIEKSFQDFYNNLQKH